MSEENKREEGRPAAPEQQEPANTQEVAGSEPAGAGAEHPNQPQPDTMPEHSDGGASGKPAEPSASAPAGEGTDAQTASGGESAPAGEGAGAGAGAAAAADPEREAKIKAAQEARAARLAAKAAAEGGAAEGAAGAGAATGAGAADPEREAKIKAAQEARAARLAAKAAAEGGAAGGAAGAGAAAGAADPEREAKIKAAQEARAARLAAKAAAEGAGAAGDAPAEPKPPSPKQPWLDEAVELLKTEVHPEAVEEAVINELAGDMPTITVKAEHWRAAAELLRDHEKLGCKYLRNVTGVDYETHLEVDYFVINLETKREYAIKIRTDREQPSVPSATPVWPGANWPEREIYDLLGVDFPGHPDLRRILMPDDWVGHPLRKDYVPLDPEV